MPFFRFPPTRPLITAVSLSLALLAGAGVSATAAADPAPLRPEIGKPLQAAQDLLKNQKFKDALAKVREADAVGGKTASEQFTIDRMRASAAYGAGDYTTAAQSFEAVIAADKLPAPDQLKIIQALAGMYYNASDYPKAIVWLNRYLNEGGNDSALRTLLTQTYYLSGDYANAARDANAAVQADEAAGRKPGQEQLQLLANIADKQQDKAAYAAALERLVTYYPNPQYWADLLNRVQNKPAFAERLALDMYRLKLASGQMKNADHYMDMAQRALQVGFPAEAQKIVDAGYQANVLGVGSDAARHQRMRDLATRTAAEDVKTMAKGAADAGNKTSKDGAALVNLGYAFVTAGQFDKGLGLMEQGLARGGMQRPDDARLHLAIAYLQAERKADALNTFKTVQGTDGTADLARLWLIHTNRPIY